jgi:monovalent cation:H+ antiporter-2, CPA2 family
MQTSVLFAPQLAGEGGIAGYELLVDFILAIVAAFIGGVIATRLKLPVIIGYLIAGIFIGPFTPGPVSNVERVQTVAELGVALLMFALGTQFSLGELKHVGKAAIGGGVIQIMLVMAIGIPIGFLLNLPLEKGLYLGGMLAISSSIVMLKILLNRGEVDSPPGKLALGFGVVQDIAVIVLVVLLPAIATSKGGGIGELAGSVGFALLKAAIFLSIAYFVGTRVFPFILYRIISLGLRELFLITVVIIAVGTALVAQIIGLSFALGAFLAGMVISESDVADDVLNEIIPIRDVFATLFFVSIGMLIDPAFIWNNLAEVGLVVFTILVGKFAITAVIFLIFRYPVGVAQLHHVWKAWCWRAQW